MRTSRCSRVDQNYDIIPIFPRGSGGVENRLYTPEKIQREDKSLYTTRPRVTADGVTSFKDANGDQRGMHCFVIIAVRGVGDPVNFLGLANKGRADPIAGQSSCTRRAGPILNALQGKGNTRRSGHGHGRRLRRAGDPVGDCQACELTSTRPAFKGQPGASIRASLAETQAGHRACSRFTTASRSPGHLASTSFHKRSTSAWSPRSAASAAS